LKNYQPLWHAKYSGEYSTFLGNDLNKSLDFMPEYIVLVLGAGSTLEGQAIPVKLKYFNIPQIVIPEHFNSPLLQSNNVYNEAYRTINYDKNWFSNPPKGIPHFVIGPHYDEINPLLKKSIINQIDSVYRYKDTDWKEMSYKCNSSGLEIGNSSAANLFVAKQLAEKGNKVLTFIYEPFRTFYQGKNVDNKEKNNDCAIENIMD
jgi:cysteine synthase